MKLLFILIHWLINTYTLFKIAKKNMHLLPNMRLIMKAKIDYTPNRDA